MSDARPDDLVNRLHRGFGAAKGRTAQLLAYQSICDEAADEIERLRKEASQAHSRVHTGALLDSGGALP